ncbi:MAG TPA: NAD-dependent epimerase/dehydratase family protein [Vicinamibacterales bacterium]|nr:NAD-dependent epimerase/dehydratase family protein [Vicinamibacterales bacterium]
MLVTGGASFIGSHLTEALIARGARVRVADNMSSGSRDNLDAPLRAGTVELLEVDLLDSRAAEQAMKDIEVVFHLAADHGGRGYIDLHQVNCSTNLVLDGQIYRTAARVGVEKVVFASSGCVYPNHLQTNADEIVYLHEDLVQPPYDADNLYGWAKLMGELVLRAYCREGRLKGASLRYFTAYGPRCPESHAVTAMIARAFVRQSPFEVWGTGQQVRNWTYVSDVVEATIAAAERVDDGRAVNVGTMERIKVVDAVRLILTCMNQDSPLTFDPAKPTGPYNRVCDNRLAAEVLGWKPLVPFADGVRKSIEWYVGSHDVGHVARELPRALTERTHASA